MAPEPEALTELSTLTTMQVGGPARVITLSSADTVVADVRAAWGEASEWLVLGGGSNIVAADQGWDGLILRLATKGIDAIAEDDESVTLRIQGGENWDELVAFTVQHGLAGIEALAGIPGTVGAAPVQNIGAYGQEVADTLVGVHFLDYESDSHEFWPAAELELGYRSSVFKHGRVGVITSVDLRLLRHDRALSEPIGYAQLAGALGKQVGDRATVAIVRLAVLALRGSKGMVLNPSDPDSVSAGSFFTNPIVTEHAALSLPADAPRWPQSSDDADIVVPLEQIGLLDSLPAADRAQQDRFVKLSAAWLIQHAGIAPGFSLPGSRAAVSSKHTLALVNTGGSSAAEIAQLARFIQQRVQAEFGFLLQPEPLMLGFEL